MNQKQNLRSKPEMQHERDSIKEVGGWRFIDDG